VVTLAGHFEAVQDVAFAPDGTRLVTASTQSGLVWDAASGRRIASFGGHADIVTSVAFSPDGTLVVSGSLDETARIWAAATGTEVAVTARHGAVRDAAFLPGGALSAGYDSLTAVAFDPAGKLLGVASTDKTATIWDVRTGVLAATLAGHGSSVTAIAFAPASPPGPAAAATGSLDGTARTWDAATGQPGVTLTGHSSWINAVACAPSGAMIATGSGDGTARLEPAEVSSRFPEVPRLAPGTPVLPA
jgi:WD40 repeat protein